MFVLLKKLENLELPLYQKNIFEQFYYLFIFTFFTFLLSIFTTDVYAIDGSYDSAFYSIRYTPTSYCVDDPFGISHRYASFSESSSWTALDSPINNDCQFLGLLYLHTRGNFVSGNTYTFRFTVDFYNNQDSQKFMINFGVYDVRGSTTTDSSSSSTENISSFTYRIVEGSNSNRILIYVSFTPVQTLKYVGVRLVPKDLMPLTNSSLTVSSNKLPYQSILYTYLKINYEEGSNALIQNQTNVIQSQTDKVINKFDNFINIFKNSNDDTLNRYADSSFNGNSDKFDNYNQSESDLINSVDVDISDLGFSTESYIPSFSFIWDNLTDFIRVNNKVFNLVIGVLTLSFVGLVIGRL